MEFETVLFVSDDMGLVVSFVTDVASSGKGGGNITFSDIA